MTRRTMHRGQAGFTLIEVLVAITLMALVSLMAWRGLSQVAATRDWLERDAQDNQVIVRTLGQLEIDLTLSEGGHNADDAATPGQALGQGVDVVQQAGLPPELDIVRAGTGDDGSWQRVIWKIRDGALWRYTGAGGTHYPLPPASGGAAVMPGVNALGVRLWIAGQGWTDVAAPVQGKATGIEVSIERTRDGARERYTRVVVLR